LGDGALDCVRVASLLSSSTSRPSRGGRTDGWLASVTPTPAILLLHWFPPPVTSLTAVTARGRRRYGKPGRQQSPRRAAPHVRRRASSSLFLFAVTGGRSQRAQRRAPAAATAVIYRVARGRHALSLSGGCAAPATAGLILWRTHLSGAHAPPGVWGAVAARVAGKQRPPWADARCQCGPARFGGRAGYFPGGRRPHPPTGIGDRLLLVAWRRRPRWRRFVVVAVTGRGRWSWRARRCRHYAWRWARPRRDCCSSCTRHGGAWGRGSSRDAWGPS